MALELLRRSNPGKEISVADVQYLERILKGTAIKHVDLSSAESCSRSIRSGAEYQIARCGLSGITDHPALLRVYLDHGASPDTMSTYRVTLLMHAAADGQLESAEELIQRGANVHATCGDGFSAMDYALPNVSAASDMIRLLTRHGGRHVRYGQRGTGDLLGNLNRTLLATCVLCAPLFVRRLNSPTWLSLDLLRLVVTYLN